MSDTICAECGKHLPEPTVSGNSQNPKGYWQHIERHDAYVLRIALEWRESGTTTTYAHRGDTFDPDAQVLTVAPFTLSHPQEQQEVFLCPSCREDATVIWRHLLTRTRHFAPKGDIGPAVSRTVSEHLTNRQQEKGLLDLFNPMNWMKGNKKEARPG